MSDVDKLKTLIKIFLDLKLLLALPNNDYSWSSWENAENAISELEMMLSTLYTGRLPEVLAMEVLFAVTGPIQEVSLSSGWGPQFLDIAERFDAALKGVLSKV